jgi:signal peptidase II
VRGAGENAPVSTDGTDAPAVQQQRRGPARLFVFATVALVALTVDVVSKAILVARLSEDHEPVRILGGAVYLQQTRNSGAAFSFGTGFTVVLTVIAIGVVVFIVRTAGRLRSTAWTIALGLILGGAIGNLTDRVFRSPGVGRGHVVDWISLFGPDAKYWPIFNVADSAIVCGAILAGLLALRGIDIDGTHARRPHG